MVKNTYQNMNIQNEKLFKKASDEAVNLRIAEKILAEVERRLLTIVPSLFDIDKIKFLLQQLKNLSETSAPEESFQVEFRVNQEFHLWRNLLETRDQKIETFHLRRFFDSTKDSLDVAVFVALTHFYRSLPLTPANLSKFDLVVTRLFTKKSPNPIRETRLNRREITKTLNELFNSWDGKIKYLTYFSPETISTIAEIDHFIAEAKSLRDFEELIKSNLFERFRTFKREIGKQFFEPFVIAAAVECNLVIGNVFNQLLNKVNENLSTRLNSKFDFAEAFHDTSPNAQVRVSEILQEISTDINFEIQRNESDELSHIWELLQFVGGGTTSSNLTSQPISLVTDDEQLQIAEIRISHLLQTLSEPAPDIKMLRDFMQKSKFLWTLDLNDFIGEESDELDSVCREVLGIILVIDELCNHELNQRTEISSETRNEIAKALQKSQNLAEKLDNLLETTDNSSQYRLLIVSNKLLETRLKFERTIVRLGNRHLGLTKDSLMENEDSNDAPTVEPADSNVIKPRVNSWLAAATFLIVFFSGGLYFFAQQMDSSIPLAQDVEEIEVTTLPDKDHLAAAYRQKDTLFVTSKESWGKLPDVQKRQSLESLVNIPANTKIATVIVTDSDGQPLGDISADGIHFPDEVSEE